LGRSALSGRDPLDNSDVYGYTVAKTMVQVLKRCGDNLTRENVMKQAASLKDFAPIESVQSMRFDGKSWVRFGEVIAADNQ
jgi:branched-chain amino acid transport system substrate-binding protein